MKHPFVLLCALAIAQIASAADITLTDGQTFTNARIISSSAARVCIRHSGGIAQVEKTLLPPDLAARYPADPKAIEAEEAKHAADVEKRIAKEEKRREAPREQVVRSSRSTQDDQSQATSVSKSEIEYAAKRYAYRYFRDKYSNGSNDRLDITLSVDTNDPEPISGWVDQWRVSGEASFTEYVSSGGSFQKGSRRFEATVTAPAGQTPRVTDFSLR